jgi:methionyl-tRNA synthetase
MTNTSEDRSRNRFCKACGTPAEDGNLCERCGAVLELPDDAGLTEDRGAALRRDFEGRDE